MPLIVFVGISSLGALFLIVFLAQLWRDERFRERGAFSRVGAESRQSGAGRHAPATIPLVSAMAASRNQPSSAIVLRRAIQCSEPSRVSPINKKQTRTQVRREVWQ